MAECCTDGTKLIYSCSGASNVGEIADRVARKLRVEGFGKRQNIRIRRSRK